MMVPGAMWAVSVTSRTLSRPLSPPPPSTERQNVTRRDGLVGALPPGRGAAAPSASERSTVSQRSESAGVGNGEEAARAGLGDEDRAGHGAARAAFVGGRDEELVEVRAAEGAGAG